MALESPLYIFDSQVWACLSSFLGCWCKNIVCCGDKRVMRQCLASIRDATDEYSPYILERSLSANLDNLVLFLSESRLPIVSPWVTQSRLTCLSINKLLNYLRLVLPATLIDLYVGVVVFDNAEQDTQCIVLNGAKLVHFGIGELAFRNGFDTGDALMRRLFDSIAIASAETLESLCWCDHHYNVGLDMSSLIHVTSLETRLITMEWDPISHVWPPNVQDVVVQGVANPLETVTMVRQYFGKTLVSLDIQFLFGSSAQYSCMSVSMLPQLEVLYLGDFAAHLTCAPQTNLSIFAYKPLAFIINEGEGTLRLHYTKLYIGTGVAIQPELVTSIDWQSVRILVFRWYHDTLPIFPTSASNIGHITIKEGSDDSVDVQTCTRILERFCKLPSLKWHVTPSLCAKLIDAQFVLPKNILSLVLKMRSETRSLPQVLSYFAPKIANVLPLSYTGSPLLSWIRHTPSYLDLDGFPFTPEIVQLCNSASSTLEMVFSTNSRFKEDPSIDWSIVGPFKPSPSVVTASFFFLPTNGVQLLQSIFGSHFMEETFSVRYNHLQSSVYK